MNCAQVYTFNIILHCPLYINMYFHLFIWLNNFNREIFRVFKDLSFNWSVSYGHVKCTTVINKWNISISCSNYTVRENPPIIIYSPKGRPDLLVASCVPSILLSVCNLFALGKDEFWGRSKFSCKAIDFILKYLKTPIALMKWCDPILHKNISLICIKLIL